MGAAWVLALGEPLWSLWPASPHPTGAEKLGLEQGGSWTALPLCAFLLCWEGGLGPTHCTFTPAVGGGGVKSGMGVVALSQAQGATVSFPEAEEWSLRLQCGGLLQLLG